MVHERARRVKSSQSAKKAPNAIPSRAAEILKELELLNWHKIKNEAALKSALIKSSKSKQQEILQITLSNEQKARERKLRIEAIMEEERIKPLHLNPGDLDHIKDKHREDERKLESDTQRHVIQLRKLRQKFAERESLQARNRRFQQERKLLTGRNGISSTRMPPPDPVHPNQIAENLHIVGSSSKSLDTLIDLETRIQRLESKSIGKNTSFGKCSRQFIHKTKQPIPRPCIPSKKGLRTLYPTRPHVTPSTFLTAIPDQKLRQIRRMTDRQRRHYLQIDKQSEEQRRTRKQDVVIAQWLEQKRKAAVTRKRIASNQNRKQRVKPPKVVAPLVGAASGRRITNTHMQKLENMKKGIDQRRNLLRTEAFKVAPLRFYRPLKPRNERLPRLPPLSVSCLRT
uniref:Uncharacterized protein AlNc14C176G8128 n=1 Tax=Albugo laibachii Nc14 TaxID=890382 RepID=F0WNX3_9STRA|nr:conserved hypothetical protein [Albugo laibachii Nc14]|eukprot:CCA23016.1 conserved hypothetical protein [Albugo laibachii Nc14]